MSQRQLRANAATSKRQLRAETESATQKSLKEAEARPVKKRKTNIPPPVRYPCFACDEQRTAKAFPDYNPSSECEHLINTCKSCLRDWVDTQIEAGLLVAVGDEAQQFGVKCPQCPAVMRNVNIEMATTKKTHRRFEELERKRIAETVPGWRWCLSPYCKGGKVHEKKKNAVTPKKSKASKKPNLKAEPAEIERMADICTCDDCGAKACVTCDRPWHEGESCSDYQARIKDRIEEEDKSISEIWKITKKCPTCQKPIQKNGGCTHMLCISCNIAFCWNCTSAPCKCYTQQVGLIRPGP